MRDGREVPSVSQGTDRAQFTSGVVKLDRLGRSTRDVLNIVHKIEEKGASLRVLEPAIDTGGPMGRMILTVLGMVAEMEHSSIFDRQRAGIEAAKAKGIYKRRPVTFDHAKIVALRKRAGSHGDRAGRGLPLRILHGGPINSPMRCFSKAFQSISTP